MERVQVFKADTTQAVKSLSELQKELREIKNRMAELDTGSDEFNNLAKKAGQITSRIGEINTAVKESAKEFSNLNKSIEVPAINVKRLFANATKIGAGIAGGFNIIGTSMKLFGNETEESNKALSEMQAILQTLPIQFIAIAQGITSFGSVLDTLKNTAIFGAKANELLSSYKLNLGDFLTDGQEKLDKIREIVIDIEALTGKSTGYNKLQQKLANINKKYEDIYKSSAAAGVSIKELDDIISQNVTELNNAVNDFISNIDVKLTIFEKIRLEAWNLRRELGSAISGLVLDLAKFNIAVIVAAITAITVAAVKLNNQIKELNQNSIDAYSRITKLFNINVTGLSDVQKEVTLIQTLIKNAKDETNTLDNRQEAIRQLNELVPDYNAGLTTSGQLYEGNKKALSDYIAELKRQAVAEAAVNQITKEYQTIIEKSAELNLAKRVKEQVDAADAEYKKAVELAQQSPGYLKTGILVIDQEVKDRTSKILTAHNLEVARSVDQLEKDIEQANENIQYIYDTYDTNLRSTTKKTGAGAGDEFKWEFINHLKPSQNQLNSVSEIITEDWIGNVPLTDVGQLLAKRVQNEIKVAGLGDTEDLTVKVNIAVGNFPENERLRQYVDFIVESQRQLAVLNETMSRFGESSLGLTGSWQNVVSDFSATFDQLANNIAKGENSFSSWSQMAASGIQSVGTLLNALSDEQDSTTKQGFESQKKYQISATVMNTLAGIINAWSSALAITPPVGPILGAANSAMIATLGAVQIAKIAKQKFGEQSSVSTSSINSTLIAPTQYTQAVQGANIETQLGDNRVWVSETDISNVGNRVRVQESENTY